MALTAFNATSERRGLANTPNEAWILGFGRQFDQSCEQHLSRMLTLRGGVA